MWMGSDHSVILNFCVFVLCILPPWGRKRGWPKHVRGHSVYNYFNIACAFCWYCYCTWEPKSLTVITRLSAESGKTVQNIGRKQSNSARGRLDWADSDLCNSRGVKADLTGLTAICATAGKWRQPNYLPRGLYPIRHNESRNVEITNIETTVLAQRRSAWWTDAAPGR
jgi:hypothetical protein